MPFLGGGSPLLSSGNPFLGVGSPLLGVRLLTRNQLEGLRYGFEPFIERHRVIRS